MGQYQLVQHQSYRQPMLYIVNNQLKKNMQQEVCCSKRTNNAEKLPNDTESALKAPQRLRIKKIQNYYEQGPTLIHGKRGQWSRDEMGKYLKFLSANLTVMQGSTDLKKTNKVFVRMSKYVKSRTSLQCTSHHQKMLEKHSTIQSIINCEATSSVSKKNSDYPIQQKFTEEKPEKEEIIQASTMGGFSNENLLQEKSEDFLSFDFIDNKSRGVVYESHQSLEVKLVEFDIEQSNQQPRGSEMMFLIADIWNSQEQ